MSKKDKAEVCDSDKDKSIELAIAALEKQYGQGVIMTGGKNLNCIKRIDSGSVQLNIALGGGYAQGRIVEIYGPESSGKTTLALHFLAEAQKKGMKCAFIDVEHALDPVYAESVGVNMDELLTAQPDSGEEALNIVEMLVKTGAVGAIVVDSVAALVPRVELEKDIGDPSVGRQAALMSQAMRMLAGPASKAGTTILFTNQIRMKIGVMFGNPETTSGGNALKFFASQRLDVRRVEVLSQGEEKVGVRTRVKVVKNKVGAPYKEVQFNILFGHGIDKDAELLDLAVEAGLIKKSGAWYSIGEEKIGQGTNNSIDYLRSHPDVAEDLRNKLLGGSNDLSEAMLPVLE